MRNRGLAATGAATGLSGLVLLLAACGGSSGTSMDAGSAYGGSSMSASPTASSMMDGGGTTSGMGTTTATLTMKTTKIGKVLTDAKGDTLYVYSKDMKGGPSTCTGTCLKEWPLVKGKPVAAMGVKFAGKPGSVKDADGTVQATYNGYPLYTYAGDMAPGETSGNGAGGVWHVITGSLLTTSSSGGMKASPSPTKSMGMGSSGGMSSSGGNGMGYGSGTEVGSGSSSSGSGSSTGSGSSSGAGTSAVKHTSPPAPPTTPAAAPTTPAPPAPVQTSPVNGGGCGSGSCW